MAFVDSRLVDALSAQLRRRDLALRGGATRVGWKLGMGDAERIGERPVVGHLTSATRLHPGDVFRAAGVASLHADVELAVRFARDAHPDEHVGSAIGGYATALEVVDLGLADANAEAIVEANVFHSAFALSIASSRPPTNGSLGRLIADGRVREEAAVQDVAERLDAAAPVLAAVGEAFRAGDWVITGSIVQAPVAAGEHVVAEIEALGAVALRIET
jgi:2-keto-4-pentenoate hydratase